MSIEVRNVSKSFGAFQALKDVHLTVETGELVALLGPSGSGKTTLLRIIAGLETPDPGASIQFFGQDVAEHHVSSRQVGFVFQHYALFKHMTVFENVAFGLRARPWRYRPSRGEIRDRVNNLLGLVQLAGFAKRYPAQLSGGQRQRVALARALAVEPKVLLLDEPFGALDAKVRRELRRWLRKLHDEVHITSLFVTHDQEEALEVSDRIAVMNKGRIEQIGTPESVYDHPANPFVYNFLGNVNLFHARLDDGELTTKAADGAKTAYVRPHDVEIYREQPEGNGTLQAKIEHIGFAGAIVNVLLRQSGSNEPLEAELTRDRYKELNLKNDDSVFVKVRNARVFETPDYSI